LVIKKVLMWHLSVILPISIGAWYFFATQQFLSFFFGSVVVFVNTGLMMWGWNLVMTKQNGSKALWVLGAKYLLLIGFISLSGFISWLDTMFFLMGLSTFFVPLLGLSLLWWQTFRSKKSFEN
jgi:hypothetical protein